MTQEQRLIALAQAIGVDIKTLRTSIGTLASLATTNKSSVVESLNEVFASVAAKGDAIGTLSGLTTTAKSNLVAAINEINAALSSIDLTGLIDDAATSGTTDKTFSASKIISLLNGLKSDIMGGVTQETLDTIKELADYLTKDGVAGGVLEQMSNRVRVDAAQTFTTEQQAQARSNINAASTTAVNAAQAAADAAQSDVDALEQAIGDTDHNYVTDYTAAKS